MIITCVCCIPCPGYCFYAARCHCYITQLVHCCPVTGIRCCGCGKRWCPCTLDRRVWSSLRLGCCSSTSSRDLLCSYDGLIITYVSCIPCPRYCLRAAVHCCYI